MDKSADFKPAGVLADFVEVTDPAWEKACETFLHEELEYVVVSGWNDAERGVELMRAESDGRATFLVHPEGGAAASDLRLTIRRSRVGCGIPCVSPMV